MAATTTKFLSGALEPSNGSAQALIGECNANDSSRPNMCFGPGTDEPIVRYDASGNRNWLHADERDHLGHALDDELRSHVSPVAA